MTETSSRTLVCSVLFVDLVEYSRKATAEQQELKQSLNSVIERALAKIPARDRILLDTGDGAAITFFSGPEDALYVALVVRDRLGTPRARAGINLGPVRLVKDLNGQMNVIGDGTQMGNKWVATCEHPDIRKSACRVEELGLRRIVTGPTREAVAAKVEELAETGAVLVSAIEQADGVWSAICDTGGSRR